jgi:hypothetical protein
MKRFKRLILSAVIFPGLGISGIKAQEAIISAGNDASGYNATLSYSVGQVVCQTSTGTSGTVLEGVQQPYYTSVVTATGVRLVGVWWSATEFNAGNALVRDIAYNIGPIYKDFMPKNCGYSVRCIKN